MRSLELPTLDPNNETLLDAGEVFDREVSQLNANWRRKPSDFFESFLKQLNKTALERVSEITLHGGPQTEEDRQFLGRCRKSFIELVDQNEISLN
jgi:hypothetical protein